MTQAPTAEIATIREPLTACDPTDAERYLAILYADLRRLAAQKLSHELPGQTLEATALVHEAYMRLVGGSAPRTWDNRGHFFAAAAEAMRRILVEIARHKGRVKRGGEWRRIAISDIADSGADSGIVALDEALGRLAAEDPIAAKVVELHHFAGLSHELVAETLEISVYRARQKWCYARAWLREALAH